VVSLGLAKLRSRIAPKALLDDVRSIKKGKGGIGRRARLTLVSGRASIRNDHKRCEISSLTAS